MKTQKPSAPKQNHQQRNPMKTKPPLIELGAMLIFALIILRPVWVQAQPTTAFTYQGQLTENGNLVTGTYDMTFALFDALASGIQQGSTITTNSVAVSGGLFTVTLDFGAAAFPGANRWLEITSRTNGGSFGTLTPRQQITSTPYAITAISAGTVSGNVPATQITGTITSAQIADGAIVNADINGSAAIADSKLGTISSTGKVLNSATTAASGNTPSTIVARDASGNFVAGTITANLTGNVSGSASTATSFSGSLVGDVTGTQGATVVAQVGGLAAATVASGASLANAAVSANTVNAIVRRDASGNFTANAVTATSASSGFNGNGSGLTSLNANNISSGTVSDLRLSANVTKLGSSIDSSEITDHAIAAQQLANNNGLGSGTVPLASGSLDVFDGVQPQASVALNGAARSITLRNVTGTNNAVLSANPYGGQLQTLDENNVETARLGSSVSAGGFLQINQANTTSLGINLDGDATGTHGGGALSVYNTNGGITVTLNGSVSGSNRGQVKTEDLVMTSSTATLAAGATLAPTKGYVRVAGSGGPVTLGATTAIDDGPTTGSILILEGTSDVNTVGVPDNANTKLSGTRTLGLNDTLMLIWNGTDWVELSFTNN
jgi:hypothetical protein